MSVEVPSLSTGRLKLRPFRPEDFEEFALMGADADVMRYIGRGEAVDRNESWRGFTAGIGHWQVRGFGLWAVEERSSGVYIGRVGVHRPEGWPDHEMAWALRRQSWGQGYATEAVRAAIAWTWETVEPPRLVSYIRPGNSRSAAVAQRLQARRMETIELAGVAVEVWQHVDPRESVLPAATRSAPAG